MTAPQPEAHPQRSPSIVPPPPKHTPWYAAQLESAMIFLDELGGMAILFRDATVASFARPFEWREVIYQLEQMGVRSVSIALITAVFVGMVMTVQFAFGLERFGATDYVVIPLVPLSSVTSVSSVPSVLNAVFLFTSASEGTGI